MFFVSAAFAVAATAAWKYGRRSILFSKPDSPKSDDDILYDAMRNPVVVKEATPPEKVTSAFREQFVLSGTKRMISSHGSNKRQKSFTGDVDDKDDDDYHENGDDNTNDNDDDNDDGNDDCNTNDNANDNANDNVNDNVNDNANDNANEKDDDNVDENTDDNVDDNVSIISNSDDEDNNILDARRIAERVTDDHKYDLIIKYLHILHTKTYGILESPDIICKGQVVTQIPPITIYHYIYGNVLIFMSSYTERKLSVRFTDGSFLFIWFETKDRPDGKTGITILKFRS